MKQIKKAITSFVLIFLPNLILAIEPGETAQKFNIRTVDRGWVDLCYSNWRIMN